MAELTPANWITLSTLRLESEGDDGLSFGTGYLYTFTEQRPDGGVDQAPVVITNKHVIEGSRKLTISVQIMPRSSAILNNGSAEGEQHFPWIIHGVEGTAVLHPDPHVDLCAIPVVGLFLSGMLPPGFILKAAVLDAGSRLTAEEAANLGPIEPIVMVGYPDGLWDKVNNRPLVRRGLTASHALQKWNGAPLFVIDAACFPGSSGSPVFLFEDGLIRVGGGYSPGSRAKLLGTLYAGPEFTAEGRLEERLIPTSTTAIPVTRIMMNLGYVIHAEALDALAAEYRKRNRAIPDYRQRWSTAQVEAKPV